MTQKEHRQFRHVMEGEEGRGLPKDRAAAAAMSVVKKGRAKRKLGKTGKRGLK